MVQWLELCTLTAKGPGSIPGLGTKIPQAAGSGQKKKKKKEDLERLILGINSLMSLINSLFFRAVLDLQEN